MKNTKGLSGVITTLIIILLVIAAIGIIWAVVNPFIKGAGDDIATQTNCMNLEIEVQSVTCTAGDACIVKLKRGADGGVQPNGVKLLFYNAAGTSNYPADVTLTAGDLDELEIYTTPAINAKTDGVLSDVATVSLASYYTDGSGNPSYCDETGSYNVVNA